MKNFILLFSFFIISVSALAQADKTAVNRDPLIQMLSTMNIGESNLGFRPKGYWTRYPDPKDIPFKSLMFDDLFSEPQRIYDFVRNMALSVDDFLNPDYLSGKQNGLLNVAYYCGIRNTTGQMRCYSASLWAEVDSTQPLLKAIQMIYAKTGRVWRFNAMGKASDFPLIEKDIMEAIKNIPMKIQFVVAKTILHILDAYQSRQIAMRNVNWEKANACWRIRQLGETQFDGLEYFHQLEDCARDIDMNSIYYAGYKLLESGEQLADTLIKLKASEKDINFKNLNLNISTPIGRIVLSGTKDDSHEYNDALLVIDFGGNDTYKGATGSTPSLDIPISFCIDLEGDDKYVNDDEFMPSQGGAIFGAAMLLDMAGNDYYKSKRLSQGAAMLGLGILADMGGNDKYEMWDSGQGAAYFGVGLAIDNTGDDEYYIFGDGQGYGGVGGVGTLINRTGKDKYVAEILPSVVFRPDYHSKNGEHNYTYCQGSGVGRRGDVTDGHSWAGGMGTIIDLEGDDEYISGNWSQGCGYWYGMGFLYDGAGNDKYKSTTWSMACGAHFCIGGFIDEAGNDEHEIWENQAVGMGFAHDYTIALFLDKAGNDSYKLKDDGLGWAINMSQVFCFDLEGDDTYIRGGKGHNFGNNNFDATNPPQVETFYHLYSDQICLFGDLNGKDKYIVKDFDTGVESSDSLMKDGSEVFFPTNAAKDTLSNKRYFGMGKDFDNLKSTQIEFFRDKMKRKYNDIFGKKKE